MSLNWLLQDLHVCTLLGTSSIALWTYLIKYMKVHDVNVVLEVNHARNYAKEVLETNEKLAT